MKDIFRKYSNMWTPPTTGYLDDPLDSLKSGEEGPKILTQLTGIHIMDCILNWNLTLIDITSF